jgi:hypothetical protein
MVLHKNVKIFKSFTVKFLFLYVTKKYPESSNALALSLTALA